MTRDVVLSDWIAASDWAAWTRHTMSGDASARRYERLTSADTSVILMDAPPDICGSQSRFVDIAQHLRRHGLPAPEILNWDANLGIMVLEDLGETDFARHLRAAPTDEAMLYAKAAETLAVLQDVPPPDDLASMNPDVGADMIDIAFEWAATDTSADLASQIKDVVRDLLGQVDPTPNCLSLRDFHAENLIWRPEQPEPTQVGLLDFQDAFITHPAYDLASLLRDARRDVNPELLNPLIDQLVSKQDHADFRNAFHVLALQRNLRIIGVFQRLAKLHGKTGYLSLLPRVWGHLQMDLAAPIAHELAPLIDRAFVPPKVPA